MRIAGLVSLLAVLGCMPELPPLEYRGERVVVGSDVVDQVCGGTLARLDREVVHIEERLDLAPVEDPLEIYIVSAETVAAYCEARACLEESAIGAPFVLLSHETFERSAAHELVHARLAGQPSAKLFSEGVAEAVSPPSCPRAVSEDLDPTDFLNAKTSDDLLDVAGGYYVAGEFIAWMLDQFGANAFLRLYADVKKGASASSIKAKYLDHFDREIEHDLFAHVRTHDDLDALPPEHFGCLAPRPATTDGIISLQASLDCDSGLVHNTPGRDGQGYVEWTLTLEHDQRFGVVGTVPEWTSLMLKDCGCVPQWGLAARPFDEQEIISQGTYRLVWIGALDEGLALDVQLVPVE